CWNFMIDSWRNWLAKRKLPIGPRREAKASPSGEVPAYVSGASSGSFQMLLSTIRALFILVVAGLAARTATLPGSSGLPYPALAFLAVMVLAIAVVLIDLMTPRKRIQTISAIYLGLIVGLILGNLLQTAIEPTLNLLKRPNLPPELPQAILGVLT